MEKKTSKQIAFQQKLEEFMFAIRSFPAYNHTKKTNIPLMMITDILNDYHINIDFFPDLPPFPWAARCN